MVRVVESSRRQTRRSHCTSPSTGIGGRSRAHRRRRCADRRVGSRNPGAAPQHVAIPVGIVRTQTGSSTGHFGNRDATPLTMQGYRLITRADPRPTAVFAGPAPESPNPSRSPTPSLVGADCVCGSPARSWTVVDVSELDALLSTAAVPILTFPSGCRRSACPSTCASSRCWVWSRAADGWGGITF